MWRSLDSILAGSCGPLHPSAWVAVVEVPVEPPARMLWVFAVVNVPFGEFGSDCHHFSIHCGSLVAEPFQPDESNPSGPSFSLFVGLHARQGRIAAPDIEQMLLVIVDAIERMGFLMC